MAEYQLHWCTYGTADTFCITATSLQHTYTPVLACSIVFSRLIDLGASSRLRCSKKGVQIEGRKGTRDLGLLVELNKDLDRVQAAITALSSGNYEQDSMEEQAPSKKARTEWIDDHPEQPEGYLVFPSSKAGTPEYEAKFPSQPYITGVTSRAKTATAEARQCEEADPSCSASTLSNEEYASLFDAAMRFPDKQVGLCVAAMVSCGLMAGFRSDDLPDIRYFMELICSVPAKPLPMQILALANNAGKANQDAQMTYATLANHRQPHLDCLAYLSQLVLYQLNVSKLPLLALIHQNNTSWRSYRMFFWNLLVQLTSCFCCAYDYQNSVDSPT
ncbi:hypothetical protein ABBQ32_004298 [Trebouxia sp. C0010 RCD-2024]